MLQFSLHFKPQRKPWLTGQIESWFNSLERPGGKSLRALSLGEASWIVTKWIVDIYHQQLDPALDCTPAQMWGSGLQKTPILRVVPDDLVDVDFQQPIPRAIDRAQGAPPSSSGSLEF